MPNFARLQIAFKNVYVRVLTAVVLGMLTGWAIYKADIPQDPAPVVHSQNISEITQLAAQKDRLDYLMVAKPLSDTPRYIYKFKGAPQLHVVKVPSTSHINLEREVLLRNGLPYLGSLETLDAMIRRGEIDQVILALPWAAESRLQNLLRHFVPGVEAVQQV